MPPKNLEDILRDLPRIGTLVKDRGYRQVWRFDFNDQGYFLKFYPRGRRIFSRDAWRRRFRGSPAMLEFARLQWLQRANIPAPRAIAMLGGFVLNGVKGDAVILTAIEPSVSLDELLNAQALAGDYPSRQRRQLADQLIHLVHQIGKAGYGHDDLHLGNFLLKDGKLHLIDAYALNKGGLKTSDIMLLGASVSRFATTTDIVRAWRKLVGDTPAPRHNPMAVQIWNSQLTRIRGDNRYFGRIATGGWRGVFFRHSKHPRRWSDVSRIEPSEADWQAALPTIAQGLADDTLTPLKVSPSGDVYETTVTLAGRNVPVVVKRPHKRYWYRYVNEIGRGSRSRRAWHKAWSLVVRDLPTAWPIAFFERRTLGYVTESFIVFEKVEGPTLWKVDLDALTDRSREMLLRRTGRILRLIELYGLSHFDAKASNWLVRADEKLGPTPVLVDVDGIRFRRWPALGIERLLRSMIDRRQYSPQDSLALCKGYAPFARLEQQPIEGTPTDDEPAGDQPADPPPEAPQQDGEPDGRPPGR